MPPFLRYLRLGVVALACSALPWKVRAQEVRGTLCGAHSRCLVIDAQDAGMAAAINRASFAALDGGALASAGVLVPAPWFPEVVRWSRAHPNFDFGIQLDLNAEWASFRWPPLSAQPPGSGLRDPAGYLPNDARYIAQHANPDEVVAEFRAQIDAAKAAGLSISHLDTHGGIELYTPWLFQSYWKAAQDAGLPAVCGRSPSVGKSEAGG